MAMRPTREQVLAVLDYDPETGEFVWKCKRGSRAAGQTAGMLNDAGYVVIYIDGIGYRAHQLAWLIVKGAWPSKRLDHEDTHRANNRIANLREATPAQNGWNKGPQTGKKYSPLKGVSFDRARVKWVAQIRANGIVRNLGRFKSEDDASAAYRQAAHALHGEFARFN